MSNNQPSKPDQRFSRYSRATYDDVALPEEDDGGSLTEITRRALQNDAGQQGPFGHEPDPHYGRGTFGDWQDEPRPAYPGGADQPPPPEELYWDNTAAEGAVHTGNGHALPPLPQHEEPAAPGPLPEMLGDAPAAPRTTFEEPPAATPEKKPKRRIRRARAPEADEAKAARRKARQDKLRDGAETMKSAMRSAGQKAGPALVKSGMWIANNLRRREIRRRLNRLMVFGHTHLTDRRTEQLFFVPSRMAERFDPAPDRGIHYDGPVPVKPFQWIMSMMPGDLREYAFIDVRAGHGRASLLAAAYNFKQIIAYEYEPVLFDDLKMNIAQFPRSRMICRNIDAHRGDVDGIAMPDQPCIVYFSNAWREPVIEGVVNYISDTYRQSPRPIYIILENTAADTALAQTSIFDAVEPPVALAMKLKLLSPVDFKVYRSAA